MAHINKKRGITLLELVVSLMLIAIVLPVVGLLVTTPMRVYVDTVSQNELSEIASGAVFFMERELQKSLPNSIRVKNGTALEFFPVYGGGRYRNMGPVSSSNVLSFVSPVTTFNILIDNNDLLSFDAQSPYRLVIYNIGAYGYSGSNVNYDAPIAGLNVYNSNLYTGSDVLPAQNTHVITPINTTVSFAASDMAVSNGNETHVTLSSAFQFAFESPRQRIFVVQSPVSYICDTTSGTLKRYTNYDPTIVQPAAATDAPLTGGGVVVDTILNKLQSCSFNYNPGTDQRGGILTVKFTIGDSDGNSAGFVQQIRIQNAS